MKGLGIFPQTKGVYIHAPALLKTLADERVPSPSAALNRGQYLSQLLSLSQTPKKAAPKVRHKVVYDYKIIGFTCHNGKHTSVSFKQPFYQLHVQVLGQQRLSDLIRDIGRTYVLHMHIRKRKRTRSERVRAKLVQRTKHILKAKERLQYKRALRALKAKPQTRQDTRVIKVPAATLSGYTVVRLPRVFCERCSAILGPSTFRALLRAASACYDREPFKRRGYRRIYITGYVSNMIEDLAPFL